MHLKYTIIGLLLACSSPSSPEPDKEGEAAPSGEDSDVADSGGGPADSGSADSGSADSGAADSGAADTGASDTGGTEDSAHAEAEEMASAAQAFLDSLDAEQRDAVQFDLSDPERSAWSNLPHSVRPRLGLSFGGMTEAQEEAAWALIRAGLSAAGEQRATEIMWVEQLLWDGGDEAAVPHDYFFTIFDAPSAESPWAWQLDGHHLAINITMVGHEATIAPSLWGVSPSVWPEGEYAGLRPMQAEEELAFEWIASLDPDQLALAMVPGPEDPRLRAGPDSDPALWPDPAGIPTTSLNESQRAALLALVEVYVGNLVEGQAAHRMAEIEASFSDVSVAWMGSTTPGESMYYRIQGSGVLVEFDHTSSVGHIHAVLRDPANEYGRDWLAEHLGSFHAH